MNFIPLLVKRFGFVLRSELIMFSTEELSVLLIGIANNEELN